MREAILKYGTPRRISSGSLLYILKSRSGQIITTAENSTPKTAMLRTPMATRVLMLSVSLLPQYWAISTLHPGRKAAAHRIKNEKDLLGLGHSAHLYLVDPPQHDAVQGINADP